MGKVLVICNVRMDFFSPNGEIFRIGPDRVGSVTEAPAWIVDTTAFRLLSADGTICIVDHVDIEIAEVPEESEPEKPVDVNVAPVDVAEPEEPVAKTKKRAAKKG